MSSKAFEITSYYNLLLNTLKMLFGEESDEMDVAINEVASICDSNEVTEIRVQGAYGKLLKDEPINSLLVTTLPEHHPFILIIPVNASVDFIKGMFYQQVLLQQSMKYLNSNGLSDLLNGVLNSEGKKDDDNDGGRVC